MKARFLHPMLIGCLALFGAILLLGTAAEAATIVALGASNTYGKGVARNQAYPAQLEAILRARGSGVHVVNAGINGDTTEGMLRRLDQAVPKGTSAVILFCNPVETTGERERLTGRRRFKAAFLPEIFRSSCSETAC